jgi:hypothetical protein
VNKSKRRHDVRCNRELNASCRHRLPYQHM